MRCGSSEYSGLADELRGREKKLGKELATLLDYSVGTWRYLLLVRPGRLGSGGVLIQPGWVTNRTWRNSSKVEIRGLGSTRPPVSFGLGSPSVSA